jgi:arylsulfatase A-like enzyme
MTGDYPFSSLNIGKEITLAEILNSIGYISFGVVGTFVDVLDFNTGFNGFWGPRNLETSKDINTVRADVIANKALEILTSIETKNKPIFLWVFFKDPHWPYLPPEGYRELFLNDSLYNSQFQQLKINDNFHDSLGGIGEARLKDAKGNFITDRAYYISQYDAEIFFVDFNVGRIINYLKDSRYLDDWMIILIADHGESLGENEYYFDHAYDLSQGSVKIPLIIKFPGQNKIKIKNKLVSICDIYPTITDLLRLNRTVIQHDSYGKSLVYKTDLLKTLCNTKRTIMLNNSSLHENRHEKLFGCIWERYKLIWNTTKNEKKLYSLNGQEVLIEKYYNDSQKKLIDKMSNFIKKFFSGKEMDQPDIKVLRSLGYLQ